MSFIFAAVLTALLVGTTMSASILHKEIEIGHNGVHYKVTVDAEKEHAHGLEDHSSDAEHQEDLGRIGVHYELHDSDHSHHHDEEGEHHEVEVHIDLGGDHHDSEEDHHHDEIHHGQKHQEEHHVSDEHSHHVGDQQHIEQLNHLAQQLAHHQLQHEVHPYGLKHQQVLTHEDLEHLLGHHDSEEHGLGYNSLPHHHAVGPHVKGKYYGQNYGFGHGQESGNLLHLQPSHIATPMTIYGGIHRPDIPQFGNAYHQDLIQRQPFVELHDLHHQIDLHH